MKDMRAARWWGVISLFIIVAISYVDRINLSILILDQGFLDHIGLTDRKSVVRERVEAIV